MIDDEKRKQIVSLLQSHKFTKLEIAKRCGVGRGTVFNIVKEEKAKKQKEQEKETKIPCYTDMEEFQKKAFMAMQEKFWMMISAITKEKCENSSPMVLSQGVKSLYEKTQEIGADFKKGELSVDLTKFPREFLIEEERRYKRWLERKKREDKKNDKSQTGDET